MKKTLVALSLLAANLPIQAKTVDEKTPKTKIVRSNPAVKKAKVDYKLRTHTAPAPLIHNNATTLVTVTPSRPRAIKKKISKEFPRMAFFHPDSGLEVTGCHVDKNGQTTLEVALDHAENPVVTITGIEWYTDESFAQVQARPFDADNDFLYMLVFTNNDPNS